MYNVLFGSGGTEGAEEREMIEGREGKAFLPTTAIELVLLYA